MDIDGLGAAIVDALIEKGLIKSPADIYYLTLDDVKSLWKAGSTAAKKLLAAIEASKEQDVSRLIYALGIRQVGAKTGKVLASAFGNLDGLMAASVEELTEVPDVGAVTAENIYQWFRQEQSAHMVERLRQAGVNFESKRVITDARFAGKTFVLTGALSKFTREEATEKIELLGGNGVRLRVEKDQLCGCGRKRRFQGAQGKRAGNSHPHRGRILRNDAITETLQRIYPLQRFHMQILGGNHA